MKKLKRWPLVVICAVIGLTVWNILPTLFFYTKPLNQAIGPKQAKEVALSSMQRVNRLEEESLEWIASFNKLLGTKTKSVSLDKENPDLIHVEFVSVEDAKRFRNYLPRAGALVSFVPAQLSLADHDSLSKKVLIHRNIPIHFEKGNYESYFDFAFKHDENGNVTPLYREIIDDRLLDIGLVVGGVSENAQYLEAALHNPQDPRSTDFLLLLSRNIINAADTLGESSSAARRYYASFTQGRFDNRAAAVDQLSSALNGLKDRFRLERINLEREQENLRKQESFLDSVKKQKLDTIESYEKRLSSAAAIITRQKNSFTASASPLTFSKIQSSLASAPTPGKTSPTQTLAVGKHNPLIESIEIDWITEQVELKLHNDILKLQASLENGGNRHRKEELDQLIYNEIARITRETGEDVRPHLDNFQIALSSLGESNSFLSLKLGNVAEKEMAQLKSFLEKNWNPEHQDLRRETFPIYDSESFARLPKNQKHLGLVLYAPVLEAGQPPQGMRNSSIYVIAKGIDEIVSRYEADPQSPQAESFIRDFGNLQKLLRQNGYTGYSGRNYPLGSRFAADYIFEAEDYYQNLLSATRESFEATGTHRFATLEFSNVKQRILTLNRIETTEHEELLKWRDSYSAAQSKPDLDAKLEVPKPTTNPLWANFLLSTKKYFRGDERKILHWGLDLSGGKTVQIALRDTSNRLVTDEADISQGINELSRRVNKMGVSEVSIRREGSHITLDFPGAQGLSAADLIKASSMHFHVVNEQFSTGNSNLSEATSRFLQEVWNEAVVTGKKDIESINQIAWRHLYGEGGSESNVSGHRSEAARMLYKNGLRLASVNDTTASSAFNDSISKIALFRGDNFTEWHNQTHPLLIVFKNYALEGANLENIRGSYDPMKGNFLSFEVASGARNDFYDWTATFSKDRVASSALSNYSGGRGWRMAVILNGSIISAPGLEEPLRNNASIYGSFTTREVNRLESDLKAGSLTFTPQILSEQNVSPELGQKERMQGIVAMLIALGLVFVLMVGYYRFAGVIASVAVLFNILIMWATLQNIQATITLAGIAGIILTMGMAVDANVLVFERIREEFKNSGRIGLAINTGYRKAFSAIADSNITTIIAALILLNFNSGPIKGFAITLIVGIVSSMFTALFMTRTFFTRWAQNPKNKELPMASLLQSAKKINFLKLFKPCVAVALVIAISGGYTLFTKRNTLMGMDFTGGYSLTVEVEPEAGTDYRKQVENALLAAGASKNDFDVRVLAPANHLRLFFGTSMDAGSKPFYGMPLEILDSDVKYSYQNNPRINWVVGALEQSNVELTQKSLQELDQTWSSISGQMSDSMRKSALFGLSLALLCILLYITIRFEFKYAVSATICLAHDVVVTLGALALLYLVGVPLQIDLKTIAALMTIVGYSLNDTIIIFDRIREDLKLKNRTSFKTIINGALNATLSRTVMTSTTTLAVLLAIVILGGSSIFGFAFVMLLGVIFGTLSSLFIAAPLLLKFHERESKVLNGNSSQAKRTN
ncbi:MAG: protein translocase subunit SecD [Candidatus Algichlamydia australiensis]|nr:protein translocase subunit SecD [Chlamydiales bacterium]